MTEYSYQVAAVPGADVLHRTARAVVHDPLDEKHRRAKFHVNLRAHVKVGELGPDGLLSVTQHNPAVYQQFHERLLAQPGGGDFLARFRRQIGDREREWLAVHDPGSFHDRADRLIELKRLRDRQGELHVMAQFHVLGLRPVRLADEVAE